MNKTTFHNLKCKLCFVLVACAITPSSFAIKQKKSLSESTSKTSIILPLEDGILPAKTTLLLTNFSIIVQSNQNILSWSALEAENGKYVIYKSENNRGFVKLSEKTFNVNTKEPSLYIFHDEDPAKGSNYYKLVHEDAEGNQKEIANRYIFIGDKKAVTLSINPLPKINRI